MMSAPMPTTGKHHCDLPVIDVQSRSYFECDVCGKDWIADDLPVWTDPCWRRAHWWNRARARRRVGIDEHCPECGYRAWRQFKRDIDRASRMGGSVVVGYTCQAHSYENWSPEHKAAFNKQIERLHE